MSQPTASQLKDFAAFFTADVSQSDPELYAAIAGELGRQQNQIELIASENIVSKAVLQAMGSVLTNKYAEGYPGRRYYGGCEFVDIAEQLAIDRAKRLFDCEFANVQPHSGAQANNAVYMALLKPGDTLMGMSLAAGGHLTHGAPPNQSGKWFHAVQYGVRRQDALIDFDEVERLAKEHKPKIIVAGGSAYPRIIDFARFRKIADTVGAYFMVDMAHFAGLVAGGVHPSPLPHAHIVTTTTHKTLRGARGGMILSNDPEIGKKINSAIFPGTQGGPLMHMIAGKAVALGEALRPDFKVYARAVVDNAKTLASTLLGGRPRHRLGRHGHPSAAGRPQAQEADRRGRGEGARARRADLQQERHPVRPREADGDVGRPPRHARGHDARLRTGGIPPGRRDDRGSTERPGGQRREQPGGGELRAGAGRRPVPAFSGLSGGLNAT